MSNIMNQKQFTDALNGVIRSATNQRDKIQNLAIDALRHYASSGDATRLSTLIHRIRGVKSLNTSALKQYIESHANLTFTTMKDGTYGFRKSGKGEASVTEPVESWYVFRNQTTQPQSLDFDKSVTSLVKKIQKARENEQEITVSDRKNVKNMLAELEKVVAE